MGHVYKRDISRIGETDMNLFFEKDDLFNDSRNEDDDHIAFAVGILYLVALIIYIIAFYYI